MALDFPASPTIGQTFTAAGVVWTWDGAKWTASGLSIAYVPMAGYVPAMNDNRIINGDMRIDQRNGGASGTANTVYTIDRWFFGAISAIRGTWGQNLNAVAGPVGFPYYLGFQSTSAYTPAAGDWWQFNQKIEADFVSDFAWGTANAQPVTLSFWARSSLTGLFGGAIQNTAGTRSYPFSYSLPTANTWTKIVITIPGDTGGAWVMSGNGAAFFLNFAMGAGSTLLAPAGAWVNGGYSSATGAINVVATNNATFYLTGVKLEIGSVATPFNRQSLAKSMADCQRYFQKLGGAIPYDLEFTGYAQLPYATASVVGFSAMRAAPTATVVGTFTSINLSSVHLYAGLQTLSAELTATAAGYVAWYNSATSAYITLSAEL